MIVMCASDCSTGWSYVHYHYKIFLLVTAEYVRLIYIICILSFNACSVFIHVFRPGVFLRTRSEYMNLKGREVSD